MVIIKEIKKKDFDLCFKLDSNAISLWNINQWEEEFNKKGVKIHGLFLLDRIVGTCSFQVVINEAQINYFAIDSNFRRQGFGSYLMSYLICECENMKIDRILLEVSVNNLIAEKFYSRFNFLTVGLRKNYYRDGSDALLKEKKLSQK